MTKDYKSISITSLVEQFKGNVFASLIVDHYEKLDAHQTGLSINSIKDEIPVDNEELENWIDSINSIASETSDIFWSGDCGEVYKMISEKAKCFLRSHSVESNDYNIFNLCELVIGNFAYAMHMEPKMKSLIKGKSDIKKGVRGWPVILFCLGWIVFFFYAKIGLLMIFISLAIGSAKYNKMVSKIYK